ncbi:MAG TPA: DNA alkylation repair protein [Bacteroidales bacterium]|jgi:3-methyladenine DNA glycosylase AlkD|nr:DNA alkylation repair protein [Bacteroidales bacterium]HOU98162.1 DNA alkylation repair protein [Bacteroidales bacterium]
MIDILKKVHQELLKHSNPKVKEGSYRYFKETIHPYGVKAADTSKISKELFKEIKEFDKETIFNLCEELFKSGYLEASFIACNWSYKVHKKYKPTDFDVFESWIKKYINNWATCDTFCNHTVGEFIEMYPDYINRLKKFTYSENRWVKRASAVSLIIPAKKGMFLPDIFEIADILLLDKDDMVQKGYGWMLKVASQVHQKEVIDFIMQRKDKMPRTALRYAIEKMPAELKQRAMIKNK